jgi:hypothetical protein
MRTVVPTIAARRRGQNPGSSLLSTAARSFPTISSQEEWEQHGEMIIRTTSRLCIAGATEKKGRKGVDNCPVGGQQLNISTRY